MVNDDMNVTDQELEQLRRDNAALLRLRAEAGQLRAELAELGRLRAENERFRAAFPGVLLVKDMAKAKAAQETETCMNHLREIYIAGMVRARDNGDRYPQNFLTTSNDLLVPFILHCPADKAHIRPQSWAEAAAGNVSYQSFALGTVPDEGKIYAWFPIHHQGITAHGRVAGPSPDAAMLALPQSKDR